MDLLWTVLAGILLITGLIGCFLPVLPGTPLSYVGMLLLQLRSDPPFTTNFMIFWAVVTIIVALLDYWIPAYGTKKFGGTRYGVFGTFIGLFVGLVFFPPFGIILGPLLGALAGELVAGSNHKQAVRAAFGSFIGFLLGTLIKLSACVIMLYFYFKVIIF